MNSYTPDYAKGYRDYVNGFEVSASNSDYLSGYSAARNHFFKDIPYDEDVLGGMYW